MRFFDPQSPFMVALGKLLDVIMCNIAFVIMCLPVISAGASLCALNGTMMLIAEDAESSFAIKDFKDIFIRKFKTATLLWLFCLVFFVFLYYYYYVVQSLEDIYGRIYGITFYVLCFVFLSGFIYFFPLCAKENQGVIRIIKHSFFLSASAFPRTLFCIMVIVLAAGATFVQLSNPPAFYTAIVIWLLAGFGLVSYFINLIIKELL